MSGKVALISGAARGIGASAARLLSREGAAIVLGDVLDELGQSVEAEIKREGGRAKFVHLDVSVEEDWLQAVAVAETTFGKVDVLFSNAGINDGPRSVTAVGRAEWDRVIAVNLTGMFLAAKTVVPAMQRAGGGSIINTSSVSGIVASGSAAYGASKGGIRLLTKTLAKQLAHANIRVNCVCPGPTDTAAIRVYNTSADSLRERVKGVPLGRIARPEEIAEAVLFLASDESSFMTGSDLVVDGGVTAT